jgi:CHAT domain-containing protein
MLNGDTPAAACGRRNFQWREKRWHTPYYWAAFILQGEWR